MKKHFLLVVFFFICFKSFPIIFWQPYPIVATVTNNAGHQRIQCSVYDSLLGSTQFFNTPYFPDSVLLNSNSTGIICFNTYSLLTANFDSTYGYIIYDQELHLFKHVIKYHQDPDYPGVEIGTYDNMVSVYYQCCRDNSGSTGYSSFYETYLYDITAHSWISGPGEFASSDGWCSVGISKGALVYGRYNDDFWDPYNWCGFYDPVNRNFNGPWNPGYTFGDHGNQDGYFLFDEVFLTVTDEGHFSAFDPGNHAWPGFSVDPVNDDNTFENNGIIYVAEDDIPSDIAIYDDSTHLWIKDHHEHTIQNVLIKDRVVTYVDSAYTQIYYEAFSPSLRAWVKDSSLINSLDTIYISEGTVNWVDGSGSHIAGYNDTVGWGNFNTPLQLNFHLTDFYAATGYPLFYVRDYSIGTDSTWYEFGDGISTSPGVQHSLWHLAKVNGHYAPSASNNNVCINANSSSGIQSWCGSRTQPCSVNFSQGYGCVTNCEGQLIASVVNGNSPFTYLWSTGDTTSVIDSLCYGSYSVTVTDSSGCIVTHHFSFDTLTILKTATSVSCNGLCDGDASIFPTGGTFPYTYTWNTGDTASSISSQCSGTYSVTVQDSNNCSVSASIVISQPLPLTYYQDVVQPSCMFDGKIDITCVGGTGPYSLSCIPQPPAIYNVDENTFAIPDLLGGIYSFTITDTNGCSVSFSITLNTPPPITSFSVTGINTTCFDACDGSFIPVVVGGTPPFYYYECNVGPIIQGTICAGQYCIATQDNNGCLASDSLIILSPPQLIVSPSTQQPSCIGCADGTIGLVISGGIPPYVINWLPNNGSLSGDSIQNLPAGIYYVSVDDSIGCDTLLIDTLYDPVGIADVNGQGAISVSPNPVSSQLTVGSLQLAMVTIEILNAMGEQLTPKIISTDPDKMIVDVSDFYPGIYFLKVTTEKGTSIQKFIKQ